MNTQILLDALDRIEKDVALIRNDVYKERAIKAESAETKKVLDMSFEIFVAYFQRKKHSPIKGCPLGSAATKPIPYSVREKIGLKYERLGQVPISFLVERLEWRDLLFCRNISKKGALGVREILGGFAIPFGDL